MTDEEIYDQLLNTTEDETFLAFLLLKEMYLAKKRKNYPREEIYYIYKNYALLLTERKKMLEYRKRLEAVNGFMGLH